MPYQSHRQDANFMTFNLEDGSHKELDVFNVPKDAFDYIDAKETFLHDAGFYKEVGNVTFWLED